MRFFNVGIGNLNTVSLNVMIGDSEKLGPDPDPVRMMSYAFSENLFRKFITAKEKFNLNIVGFLCTR